MGAHPIPAGDRCPGCGASLVTFHSDDHAPGNDYASNRAQRVFDRSRSQRALLYRCPDCSHVWHRWDRTSPEHWLAQEYLDERRSSD